MKTPLLSGLLAPRAGSRRWLLAAAATFCTLGSAQAQFNYTPANATNIAGTYTDLGTTGTAITTTSNDDANSTAQAIGFTFTFNGTAFTQFVLSTNGLIKLGATAPSAANLFICNVVGCTNIDPVESTNAADVNLILPFNFDLEPGTATPEYRVATTGTAPNRVCTIQWKNVSDKADATPSNKQYSNMSFQAKLYETTNNVEFVYGPTTASTATAESRFPNVGMKGTSSASGQDILASKTTGAALWSTSTFITGSYPGSTHNIRNSATPDAGRTFRFVAATTTTPTAPVNDNCTTATALTTTATCTPVTTTNAAATASPATVPAPSCGTTTATTDVWYSIVVPASGSVTVTTSAITGSSVDDTVLELYSGTCGSLTSIGCNDDATGFYSSFTATGLTAGSTIYARVWSYTPANTGQFGICATTPATAPANDNPAGAITLPVLLTCTPTSGTNAGATTTTPSGYANPGAAPYATCGIAVNPKDVWYKFTTAATGNGSTNVTITVTGATAGYLRAFSSPGATGPFTEIACSSSGANNTVAAPLVLSGLTPATTYYVFVSGYGSADTQGAFTICATAVASPSANDLAVQAIYTLGTVSGYTSPVTVQAVVRNVGSAASTSRTASLAITGTTVFNTTVVVPALAVGASATISFPAYPVIATTGTNTVTVSLPSDDVTTNNSIATQQALTSNRLSYSNPAVTTFAGGFGSNTVANATVYVKYRTNTTPTNVTSIIPTFQGTATTPNNYQVMVVDATGAAGAPGTTLYTSPARVRPLAGGPDVVAVPNVVVAGDFYVAVTQLTTTNMGLAYQSELPLRPGTFLFSTNGTTFTDLSTQTGIDFRAAVDVTLRNPLATRNEALGATVALYPNPAHSAFTLSVPAGTLAKASATLSNALGQVVQTRQLSLPTAGGSVEFNVNGLAAGVYSLQLKSGNDLVVKRVVVE